MSNAREQAVVAVGAAEDPMEGGDRCSQNLGFIAVKLAPPHHRDGAWQYMAGSGDENTAYQYRNQAQEHQPLLWLGTPYRRKGLRAFMACDRQTCRFRAR